MKMNPQQYCLRWKHHHSNVQSMFSQLLEKERFCDVTLYCSPSFSTQVPDRGPVDPHSIRGVSLRAHRVVLAACSEMLGALLGAHEAHGEPVLVIDGAEPKHVKALLDYMYTGEMNVHHSQLASLLKTAEELRIKGLTDIRWNNKDEPPDCQTGATGIITTTTIKKCPETSTPEIKKEKMQPDETQKCPVKMTRDHNVAPINALEQISTELRSLVKKEHDLDRQDKFNVNGGPPPLIKLTTKEKLSPIKRDHSDTDSPSPKRQRLVSGADPSDDDAECKFERDQEWQHGNLDITAERVVGWGMECESAYSRDGSDDEWADAPTDIGSFLHTRLRVDGDNSADECSNESASTTTTTARAPHTPDVKEIGHTSIQKLPVGPKSGPHDPRFTDVIKLHDYLQHGRRPQFWEENYVKRVMEAVRLKELEMKQAAEILGVSYGTLYGRYRDVYGCINRPYRTARDFWQAKGPSDVVDRLEKGELSLNAAAQVLGVSTNNLAAYVSEAVPGGQQPRFEPIPIEIDPSLRLPRLMTGQAGKGKKEKPMPRRAVGSDDDDGSAEGKPAPSSGNSGSPKWPAPSPATATAATPATPATPPVPVPQHIMRSRPDLTIVAAKRPDKMEEDST